jgi:hypothetical protein
MNHRLTFIVPSRNRPDLAVIAIRSILAQDHPTASVIVSDNSTDVQAQNTLAAFCREQAGVRYIRPDEPCSMSQHWSWLLRQAATGDWGTHIAFLTDRMFLRERQLTSLCNIIDRHPKDVITYLIDGIRDDESPIRLRLHAWSGRVLRVASTDMLTLLSRAEMPLNAPLLLNSIVPVNVLATLQGVYQELCDTIAPDYSFCLKFLDHVDSYVFFDKPVLVQHGLPRSNGQSFTT